MASSTKPIIDRKKSRRSHEKGVIQFHILMRLAYKNLFFKKLRTTLTILGVIIGIGSIVFLLSFGFGIQDLVGRQVVGSNSVQTVDVTNPRSKALKLNQDIIKQISAMQGVEKVYRSFNTAGKLKLASSQTESIVYGVDPGYIDLSSLQFVAGSSLREGNMTDVVINSSLAKALGLANQNKALGQVVQVNFDAVNSKGEKKTVAKELSVRGVFDSDAVAEAFIPAKVIEQSGVSDATQLKVVVPVKDNIDGVRKSVEGLGFTTASPLDTIDQINQFFTLLRFILLGFGGIGMIIAILGMFNTLTISLLERTREIGLMISLGARKQDVRRLFIVEALLLSALGGFIGVIGAVVLGAVGNFVLNSFARSNGVKDHITAFIVSPTLAVTVLLLSCLVGLLVVYFPARRAAQISPIDALHNE